MYKNIIILLMRRIRSIRTLGNLIDTLNVWYADRVSFHTILRQRTEVRDNNALSWIRRPRSPWSYATFVETIFFSSSSGRRGGGPWKRTERANRPQTTSLRVLLVASPRKRYAAMGKFTMQISRCISDRTRARWRKYRRRIVAKKLVPRLERKRPACGKNNYVISDETLQDKNWSVPPSVRL